jgi:transposase
MALGHEVRLMPPRYVKPYVKRQKNDTADAAAICEAVTRPSMSFVPVKSVDQQAALMLHRARDLLVRQRTMLINSLRGHLAEFGVIEPQGPGHVARLVAIVRDNDDRVPELARQILEVIVGQLEDLAARVGTIERQMLAWHKSNPTSRRLATIPGIGPVVATAIAASVPDPGVFRSGRQFAAWLGLVPRQNSTGGKDRLGKISKQGNGYLRRLLINGAQSVLRCSKAAKHDLWLMGLLARRPRLVTAVALANKTARIAWAVMARENEFRRSPAAA